MMDAARNEQYQPSGALQRRKKEAMNYGGTD